MNGSAMILMVFAMAFIWGGVNLVFITLTEKPRPSTRNYP